MDYLPIFFDVRGKPCLLVGGGEVAARKAALLNRAGARLIVVAPEARDDVVALAQSSHGEYHSRKFEASDLDGVHLVIAATSDAAVNAEISQLADARKLAVNVVDQPPLCRFIVPAIVERAPITIAISTGGNSPVLTRELKERIETAVPRGYGDFANLLGSWRDEVKAAIPDDKQRTRFWESLMSGEVASLVFQGKTEAAQAAYQQQLQAFVGQQKVAGQSTGEVWLVGAGPGDPELLTLKALRFMYAADVVLYDRLVSDEIMAMVRPDAEKIFVGKEAKHHPVPQEQINDKLVHYARQGLKVLRLKGGDPFIFGRGGEEIEELAAAGIPFQVVPGITSASGCSAYAGIPLTHRDYSQSVRFVTGHLKDDRPDLDWHMLAQEQQTLVIYMGLMALPVISAKLIGHGMRADMPVAVVEQGTRANQRVVSATLNDIEAAVKNAELKAPALIIVGPVVKLRNTLAWFGDQSG
jgi:uroporphyrin-III C-methyltransferase/precorrin-2 dehydrogenase/sirohydrochlorin ferrochelatase